ncbi:MAG: SAM-dependent methyltransferase [Quadrisphaera sp.]
MALVELAEATGALRSALVDESFVRATASGRRRGADAAVEAPDRLEVRPVLLRGVRHAQVTERTGPVVRTRNLRVQAPLGPDDDGALDALLALPFATWHAETAAGAVQVQVTKKGLATVGRKRPPPLPVPAGAGELANDRRKQHLLAPRRPALRRAGRRRRQAPPGRRLPAPALRRAARRPRADRPLRVVDLGCGNAYLTLAAQRWLAGRPAGARTVGVELRADLVQRSTDRAAAAGVEGLTFTAGTIADADPTPLLGGPPDVVLALHACDTATDDALARAVAWGSPVVLAAPCCHRDVQRQLVAAGAGTPSSPLPAAQDALVSSPILRERFADVLTDSLRSAALRAHGYRTDVVEFVDSEHTPRNALLRAVRPPRPEPDVTRQAAQRELEELAASWRVRPVIADRLEKQRRAVVGRL